MALLKTVAVFFSFFVITLGCELTSSEAEIKAKADLETLISEKFAQVTNDRYKLLYHVAPPVGWMNDPNGFSYYKDNYHLFYQFNPAETKGGNMHWGHVTSKNLVEWTHVATALLKEEEQCYSGSAIEKDGMMILMYTAHKDLVDQTPNMNESQYLAFSSDGIVFNKYVNNPVISYAPNDALDFRDPKVWKHGDYYYVIIGSKTSDNKGRVLLYRSSDMGNWEFFSVLAQSTGSLGEMWECPDFFELGGKYVILMSPQGIPKVVGDDRYQNQFQTGYIIGTFNYTTGIFVEEVPFQEIDYGTDFYATQTMEKDGKRYLIAWMGMWDATHPEAEDGWAGAMTIVRELTLSGSRILMKPVDAMTSLRDTTVLTGPLAADSSVSLTKTGELIVTGDWGQDINLAFRGSGSDTVVVTVQWNSVNRKVVVTRDDKIRQAEWTAVSSQSWRIFLDGSSIEVFCGEGEMVFSSRAYPDGTWVVTNRSTQPLTIEAYTLKSSITYPW